MTFVTTRRTLLASVLATVAVQAFAQDGAPNEPDDHPEVQPDTAIALADGFELVAIDEYRSDPRSATIREQFNVPIEKTVGGDGTAPFEWALSDLTGDGLSNLVILPRVYGLPVDARYDGRPVFVYRFDGKSWSKALDAGALDVARRVRRSEDGSVTHDIALIQQDGYYLYRWDETRLRFVEIPHLHAPKR